MTNGDKEFDEYLDGNSGLSTRYSKLGDEEPPPEVDAAILAQAEQSAKVYRFPSAPRRWMVSVSVAATLLICFSLVLSVLLEAPMIGDENQVFEKSRPAAPPEADRNEADEAGRVAPAAELNRVTQYAAPPKAEGQMVFEQQTEPPRRQGLSDDQASELKQPAEIEPSVLGKDLAGPAGSQSGMANMPMSLSRLEADSLDSEQLMVLGQMMAIVDEYFVVEAAAADDRDKKTESAARSEEFSADAAGKSTSATLQPLLAGSKREGVESEVEYLSEPDTELRRIADLYADSQNRKAANALAEFRVAFPDHPVSRILLERGY